jgi:hypothetical protein
MPRSGAIAPHKSMRIKELKKKPGIAARMVKYPNISASQYNCEFNHSTSGRPVAIIEGGGLTQVRALKL